MFNFMKKKQAGEEITLEIIGMHCTSCAMNIDGALEDTVGVLNSETSYARSKVKVQFDSGKISVEGLTKVIESVGYKVAKK